MNPVAVIADVINLFPRVMKRAVGDPMIVLVLAHNRCFVFLGIDSAGSLATSDSGLLDR